MNMPWLIPPLKHVGFAPLLISSVDLMEDAPFPLPKEFVSETEIYSYDTPVTECINKILKFGAVVITKGEDYYGIVDSPTIARTAKSQIAKNFSVGKFAKRVPFVDSATSIDTAIRHFYENDVKAIPYSEANKIAGIIRIERVLATILSLHMLKGLKVMEGMSSPVIAIDAKANLAQAKTVMRDYRINRLVVIDNGKVAGLLNYENLLEVISKPAERPPGIKSKFYSSSNITVDSIADKVFYPISQNSPIEDAIREMLENNTEALLVFNNQRPVGIITMKDILHMVISSGVYPENTVIISGLDEFSKEYEADINKEFNTVIGKINKFSKFQISKIFVHVRRQKARNYEVRARAIMQTKGMLTASAFGYTLEAAVSKAAERLYENIKETKEVILAVKKRREREYGA